ncbi:ABC transporter ATP-binding protein [Marinobacter sp. ANT_B65]|uniref:ABC transporter ATP-binding protein n=1 Tax=Marinobacter sp. ANT_B65 TaxID=2039467 RepID=UPI000BBE8D1B|nr:ABC transporter ATP-binding protein [Marinobacter sp. ANT_B65]PCM45250.1 ABC transporter ATP-binding protein [Marinobacter sp. ANT_B65]
MTAISVTGLGKAYKQYPGKWSRLGEWLLPGNRVRHSLHWVLQDIQFEVPRGEAVGILGVNGAGKSTLLKLITGTTHPTVGHISVNGRIAALLELGMGFHPDFTGRQNVFMAGQLQGLSPQQIEDELPAIEQFAGIGEYLDQPVRVYSSGMQVRLAFALATAIRPDILIIDEALSVGDAAFQRKCFRRINEFLEEGTTLLFVTHDIDAVKKLCKRAVFLKQGRVAAYGPAKTVCDSYEKYLFGGSAPAMLEVEPEESAQQDNESQGKLDTALTSDCEISYGDGRATIEAVWLENRDGDTVNMFGSGEPMVLKTRVRFNQAVDHAVFAFMIKTREGLSLFGLDTSDHPAFSGRRFHKNETLTLKYCLANAFAPGVYYVNCGVRDDRSKELVFLHRRLDTLLFRVRTDDNTTVKSGLINVPVEIGIEERLE